MSAWEIVLLVIVALVVLLFAGGYLANARAGRERHGRLAARIAEADHALAEARATDRGWDRPLLEAAVREALEQRRPGTAVHTMELVQVVDLPGTDADSAVFHLVTDAGEERLELARSGERWTVR